MVSRHAFLAGYVDLTTIRSHDKHGFIITFISSYNLTYQDHKQAWFNVVLQGMMASTKLGHVTDIALSLPVRPINNQTWQNDRPVCTYFTLQVLASPPLDQVTFIFILTPNVIFTCTSPTANQNGDDAVATFRSRDKHSFISTSTWPITTKLSRM